MRALPGVAQLLHLAHADSTQTLARELALQGAPDRTLVWADRQQSGKGRMARRWQSPPGGLYVSLILRPDIPPTRLAELSLVTAEAAARALWELAGIRTAVKPPNDVMAIRNGRAGKIGGILIEAAGTSKRIEWAVAGLGLNVNNATRGLPQAASLKALTKRNWELAEVLRRFLAEWDRRLGTFYG